MARVRYMDRALGYCKTCLSCHHDTSVLNTSNPLYSFIYSYSVLKLCSYINFQSIFRVNYNFMILQETYSMIFLQHQFLILTEIMIHLNNHCLFIGNLVVALWSSSSSMVNIKALLNDYCKLASTSISCLEPHLGI